VNDSLTSIRTANRSRPAARTRRSPRPLPISNLRPLREPAPQHSPPPLWAPHRSCVCAEITRPKSSLSGPFAAGANRSAGAGARHEVSNEAKQPVHLDNKAEPRFHCGAIRARRCRRPHGLRHTIPRNRPPHLFKAALRSGERLEPVTAARRAAIFYRPSEHPGEGCRRTDQPGQGQPGKAELVQRQLGEPVSGNYFQQMAGVQLLHLPVQSNPLAVNDLSRPDQPDVHRYRGPAAQVKSAR